LDWEWCIGTSNENSDVFEVKAFTVGNEVFKKSKSTFLNVRKDVFDAPGEDTFCYGTTFNVIAGVPIIREGFSLNTNSTGQDCVQRGMSFAPSSGSAAVPAPGANIWLTDIELGPQAGKFVASGFEGFAAGQTVTTDVPAFVPEEGSWDTRSITLKGGPYKMAFNKAFDAANFLRSEGNPVTVLCMYGKYSA
jgi:hypothetical protein